MKNVVGLKIIFSLLTFTFAQVIQSFLFLIVGFNERLNFSLSC